MSGLAGGFDSALGASSFSDLQDALAFLDAVSQRDHDVLIGLERRKAEIEQQRVRLEALEVELRGRQERLEATAADLVEKLEQQQALQARSEESAPGWRFRRRVPELVSSSESARADPGALEGLRQGADPRRVRLPGSANDGCRLVRRGTRVELRITGREPGHRSRRCLPVHPLHLGEPVRAGRPGRRFRVRRTGERRRRCLDGRALRLAPLEIGRRGLRSLTPDGAKHHSPEPRRTSWTPRSVRPSSERGPTRYQVSIGPLPLTSIVPRRRADELILQQLVRRARDLDLSGRALGLHPARRVHGVAPEVVEEALRADHAGDDRSGVDADPQLETGLGRRRPRSRPRSRMSSARSAALRA